MSIATLPHLPRSRSIPPRNTRWTCDQFHQLGDMGWFEGKTVMLIDGEIKEMPGPNPPHSTGTELTSDALKVAFGPGFYVRSQQPLPLGLTTDPVPDVSVVKGSMRDYATVHPTSALLVVEVSDSSLGYDMEDKASLYASAGIADYWVVDLNGRRLIVFRDPIVDAAAPFGFRYKPLSDLGELETIAPLALPAVSVRVLDLLP